MATTPSIRLEQVDASAGTAGASRSDFAVSKLVTAFDDANGSGSYTWELVVPPGSATTLTDANTSTPSYTPDLTGTYLLFCEVDGYRSYSTTATGARDSTQGGAAILLSSERIPAPSETRQFSATNGHAAALDSIFRATLGGVGASGDVVGPASATDNAVARFDTTTGKLLQDSAVTVDDTGNVAGVGNITLSGTVDGRDVAADGTKLDGIEASATADQTGAEIKTAYEAEADTNAFDDAAVTKLAGIETAADVTDATNVAAAGAVMDSDYSAGSGIQRKTGSGTYVANDTIGAGVGTTVTALSDGATLTIDCSLGNVFTVTLGGNRTVAAPTNARDGQVIQFLITQDGTGSRTLTWNATFNWPGGTAPTLSTAASSVDVVSATYNGSAWYAVSALDFS